jgi:hypothetical protein
MRSRVILMLTAIFAIFTTGLFAADVNGKWTAEVPARNGEKRVQTFNLKADGDKLTGTVATPMGERPITDGTVKGDEISFTVEMPGRNGGEARKMTYVGKVSGGEIKFTVKGGQQDREITAKRATT